MKLTIDDIIIEDRLRDVAPGPVRTIAESFKAIGQSAAILVYKTAEGRFRLIDGGHRISAAKALGWAQIEADVKDFSELDEKEIEFERKMIEIDTTLARADLNVGLETDLLEQRLRVMVEKNAYADLKQALQEKEEAERKERETRAALKTVLKNAEKSRSEVGETISKNGAKKLEDVLSRAEQERKNAAKRATSAVERSSEITETIRKSGTLPDNLNGIGAARRAIATQTNRKADTIKKAMQWFDELGRDFVKKLYGTELDNHMQYLAMSRLKARYEEATAEGFKRPATPEGKIQAVADNFVKTYWPNMLRHIDKFKSGETATLPNPHVAYSEMIRDEKGGMRSVEDLRRLQTVDGQWQRMREGTSKLETMLMEMEATLKGSNADPRIMSKLPAITRMRSQASDLRRWAQQN